MATSPYVHNIVIDLEFNFIPKDKWVGALRNEILEVGAVKLDDKGSVVDTFSRIVKPTIYPSIYSNVERLTGIGDADIVQARPLDEVLADFRRWIGGERARIVTWSEADKKQIDEECLAKGISAGLPARWLDIQRIYPRLMGTEQRKTKLEKAATWCGIDLETSRAHRALYDAQITAKLFKMMATGEYREHREALQSELERSEDAGTCSASIADQCGGLADLLAILRLKEGADSSMERLAS